MMLTVTAILVVSLLSFGESNNLNSLHYYSDDIVTPSNLKDHLAYQYESKTGKKVSLNMFKPGLRTRSIFY